MRRAEQSPLQDVLQEGLEATTEGQTAEEFLAQHEQKASELGPLLRLALQMKEVLAVAPSNDAKAATRYRVLAHALERQSRRVVWLSPLLDLTRPLAAATIAAFLLIIASTSALVASAHALPGDPLYPMKTGWEQVQIAFIFDEEAKAMTYVQLAARRTEEIAELSDKGRPVSPAVVESLTIHTTAAVAGIGIERDPAALGQKLLELTERQQQVLTEVAAKAPEAARPALQHALEVSQRGHQRAEEALEKERKRGEDGPPQRGAGPQGALSPTATPRGAREEHPEGEERQRGRGGEEKHQDRDDPSQERQPTPEATPCPSPLPRGETREDEDNRGSPAATPQPGERGRRDGEGRERPGVTPTPEPGREPTPPSDGRGRGRDRPEHQDEEDED